MKKVILGFAAVLMLLTTSCDKVDNLQTHSIPSQALTKLKQKDFDTMLVVNTTSHGDKVINLFDTKQNFKGKINQESHEKTLILVLFILGIGIGLFLGSIIFIS
jgi:hypothetical protein